VATRRSLLLGGASFAAWAYLPKFARAADGRDPAADRRDPARRARRPRHRRPTGDRLCGCTFDRADAGWSARGVDAGFLFRAASGCRNSRGCIEKNMPPSSMRGNVLSRPLHFDGQDVLESGFAGPGRCNPAGSTARGRLPRRAADQRLAVGPTTPAGAAGCCADGGLGAGDVAAGRRRYRDASRRALQSRDPALASACRKACSSQGRGR